MAHTLHLGDCAEVLKTYPDNYFDAIVCDPPAGISFMGKKWDSDKGGRDRWIRWMQGIAAECLRVMKPGAHALVWSLPRTSHWTATAWENGGWEVRDRVAHVFGSGFPKSHSISIAIDKLSGAEREVIGKHPQPAGNKTHATVFSDDNFEWKKDLDITAPATDAAKQFAGFGTALKPAMEDWWLLRKPIAESSIAANVLAWGCGGLNIDKCRVGTEQITTQAKGQKQSVAGRAEPDATGSHKWNGCAESTHVGRFPAQLIHDGSDCVMAEFAKYGETKGSGAVVSKNRHRKGFMVSGSVDAIDNYGDSGTVARFFYCAKPSKAERNADGENNHPTLKSLALMRYLITLITPPGGIVLDPFAGSGTTIRAALELGFDAVGIDDDAESFATMQRRAAAATLPLFAEVDR